MEKIKNKDGRIISYREKVYINGKAVTKTFKRKSDASDWKKHFQAEQKRREALGIAQIQSIDFESFAKNWLEIKKNEGSATGTMVNFRASLNLYLLPVIGKVKLETINQRTAQAVIRHCKEKNLVASRINMIIGHLTQILNYAVKLEHLIRNPLKEIKKLKEPPRKLNYWLPKQVEAFLASNEDDHFYPLYVLALNTGMRRGELLGLCWDKVNLDDRVIEIARTRGRYGMRETTKTGVVRHIPLNNAAWTVLDELSRKKSGEDFVFLKKDGSPLHVCFLDHFSSATRRAQVPKIRFHDLRTSYASNFVMAGGDIFALSKLLGHASVEMTAKRYAALHPNFMKNVVETVSFGRRGHEDEKSMVA